MGFSLLATAVLAASLHVSVADFSAAKPIWPEGRDTEMNVSAGFRAVADAKRGDPLTLRITGSTIYRLYVNGAFVGHGPARAAKGFYRVDDWDLSNRVKDGKNVIAVEVAGYNSNSYYVLDQPSFLQAELRNGDTVLAATGDTAKPFSAHIIEERVQKVCRYSFQRPFTEYYRLKPGYDAWRSDPSVKTPEVACSVVGEKKLIARGISYPRFTKRPAVTNLGFGTATEGPAPEHPWKDRSFVNVGPKLKGFPEAELAVTPSVDLQRFSYAKSEGAPTLFSAPFGVLAEKNGYCMLDFGTNLTGFVGATLDCKKACRVYFLFDEVLSNDDVDWRRLGCVNIVAFELEPGTYTVESIEPYTLRYLKVLALDGDCTVTNPYIREYANPDAGEAQFASPDLRLNRLFDAGRETFVQNSVDVFMDCPHRERAGWLCDSFFTARSASDLCGQTTVERNFIENYLLPATFDDLPEGMLPMCYPADHYDGVFIPNWAMWFVMQLQEYYLRSNDRDMVDALKPRVMALLKYFDKFKNEDGLLEKLESWVFVEWSDANKYVQDVNYPSNMLYASVLEVAGSLYSMPELNDQAKRMREVILKQSYDGEFFVDNAVRKDGKLEVTRNRTEVCQYFAFFFNVANPDSHPGLWKKLAHEFGPTRKDKNLYPEVGAANSFVGNMLRFEILSRYGRSAQILPESIDYLLYMADRTGTLWENVKEEASCNHGFASHIVHTLYRDVLGVTVEAGQKSVTVRISDVPLDWCEGRIPTPEGIVAMRWWKEDGQVKYRLDAPAGYALNTASLPGGIAATRVP